MHDFRDRKRASAFTALYGHVGDFEAVLAPAHVGKEGRDTHIDRHVTHEVLYSCRNHSPTRPGTCEVSLRRRRRAIPLPFVMTSTLDIWNTVIGILGLLSLICQLLFWIITSRLPSAKLRVLENSLKETESLLSRCIEEGRINSAAEAAQFDCRLAELRTRTSDISLETLSAKTYLDDLRNMMQGLSQRTDDVREEVLAARVDITASSSASSQPSLGNSVHSDGLPPSISENATSASGATTSAEASSYHMHSSLACSNTFMDEGTCSGGPLTTSPKSESINLISPMPTMVDAGPETIVSACLPHEETISTHNQGASLLHSDKRSALSSSKTNGTQSLRRKKRNHTAARVHARALARLSRIAHA